MATCSPSSVPLRSPESPFPSNLFCFFFPSSLSLSWSSRLRNLPTHETFNPYFTHGYFLALPHFPLLCLLVQNFLPSLFFPSSLPFASSTCAKLPPPSLFFLSPLRFTFHLPHNLSPSFPSQTFALSHLLLFYLPLQNILPFLLPLLLLLIAPSLSCYFGPGGKKSSGFSLAFLSSPLLPLLSVHISFLFS